MCIQWLHEIVSSHTLVVSSQSFTFSSLQKSHLSSSFIILRWSRLICKMPKLLTIITFYLRFMKSLLSPSSSSPTGSFPLPFPPPPILLQVKMSPFGFFFLLHWAREKVELAPLILSSSLGVSTHAPLSAKWPPQSSWYLSLQTVQEE